MRLSSLKLVASGVLVCWRGAVRSSVSFSWLAAHCRCWALSGSLGAALVVVVVRFVAESFLLGRLFRRPKKVRRFGFEIFFIRNSAETGGRASFARLKGVSAGVDQMCVVFRLLLLLLSDGE
jgi:hypothetical protein